MYHFLHLYLCLALLAISWQDVLKQFAVGFLVTSQIDNHPNWQYLDRERCGFSRADTRSRIVGGERAALGQFPWIARMGLLKNGAIVFTCAGTLVNQHYVVTAAHCANLPSLRTFANNDRNRHLRADCWLGLYQPCNRNSIKLSIVHECTDTCRRYLQKCICPPTRQSKSSCWGDSGGPMTISENVNGVRRHFLLGVVSYGAGVCTDRPSVYTKIIYYLPSQIDNHPNWQYLNRDRCGFSYADTRSRIIGGERAALGQFPWIVRMGKPKNGFIFYGCAGTLVNQHYVVTAAHCDFVQPICLPYGPLLTRNLIGSYVQIAGWGSINPLEYIPSSPLMYVSAPIVGGDICRNAHPPPLIPDPETQYCVGSEGYSKSSCYGDSGGPMSISENVNGVRRHFLLGIVSYGAHVCTDSPTVYTKIIYYLPRLLDAILHEIENHPNWKYLDRDKCGVSRADTRSRIIGGEKAAVGQFPWIARMGKQEESFIYYTCAGMLVNQYYVITAGHCGAPDWVKLGENTIDNDNQPDCDDTGCAPPVQEIRVAENIGFDFVSTSVRNDIIFNFEFPEFVQPICLPFGSLLTRNLTGSYVQIAGWGSINPVEYVPSSPLMYVSAPIVGEDICRNAHPPPLNPDPETQYCVGAEGQSNTSCYGDSGGPMTISENVNGVRRHFLLGIVSYGAHVCTDSPSVYTKIIHYLPKLLDSISQ
nr:unnamed protein product [Callosobruchus chinensis]